ncbi:DUF1826 domain-containing protein [Yoonia sp. BS5-3]|uniref:DUF1826 domain-containing protein n=1 Tax=Yoonia phaeophyticola TaxID=3137369 RepID=A0ABZ2V8E2_9RHOB
MNGANTATYRTSAVTVVDQPEQLQAFLQADCPAAIWRRQARRDFQCWIDMLDPAQLPQGRMILPAQSVRKAGFELCEMAQTPPGPDRDRLIDDIAALSDIFAGLMQAGHLRVRLQAVNSNACRRFHIDAISARLVCTYRGPGTQYGFAQEGADPARVFSVPTGAPILLRGTQWPEQPAAGLRHRSPPIEGTGETRLVLVLDPVVDPAADT